jgi:hypothetical protein
MSADNICDIINCVGMTIIAIIVVIYFLFKD